MDNILICIAVVGVFAFGYFVVDRIARNVERDYWANHTPQAFARAEYQSQQKRETTERKTLSESISSWIQAWKSPDRKPPCIRKICRKP